MNKKKVELLSPAGSMPSLIAAVDYGADAVYIGGKRFGARAMADNFDDQEMRKAITYAHLRNAKIYVTVNTIATDREIGDMLNYISNVYSMGADGVIVQDIGTALLTRKYIPEIPVHASTQMTLHNREQVRWAEENGFEAIVLSREVPLKSIKPMFDGFHIKPEIFVHGALCYSFSGQCMYSHFRQGRSANRGECAQHCRRAYNIVREVNGKRTTLQSNGRYPLSMRDLCTIEKMDDIVESGVKLLKIEGRVKRPEYVAVTTRIYRKYLDKALESKFEGVEKKDMNLLWLAYNRNFTKGYLFEERFSEVKGRLTPDNRGLLLGNIISIDSELRNMKISVFNEITPNIGDILRVVTGYDYRKKNLSMEVTFVHEDGKDKLKINYHKDAAVGDQVYLMKHNLFQYINKIPRSIHIDTKATLHKNDVLRLETKYHGSNISVHGNEIINEARTRPLTESILEEHIRKTGGSNVVVDNIEIEKDEDVFLPISEINMVRRHLTTSVEKEWLKKRFPLPENIPQIRNILPPIKKYPHASNIEISVITEDVSEIKKLRENNIKRIFLDIMYGLRSAIVRKRILKILDDIQGNDIYLKTPIITFDDVLHAIKDIVATVNRKFGGYMVGNMGDIKVITSEDPNANIITASSFNINNSVATKYLIERAKSVTLSPELSDDDIIELVSRINPKKVNIMAGGRQMLMITNDCPLGSMIDNAKTGKGGFYDVQCNHECKKGFYYLKDDKKRLNPLWMDGDCRGHIFNNRVIDRDFKRLIESGISSYIIDLRGFPEYERMGVIDEFKKKLHAYVN